MRKITRLINPSCTLSSAIWWFTARCLMYHAANQILEYKETKREAKWALVRAFSNVKYGWAGYLYSDYCSSLDSLFITPMTVRLRVFTRPMSTFTGDISFIRFACLTYKNRSAKFSTYKWKCKNHGKQRDKRYFSQHLSSNSMSWQHWPSMPTD